MSVTSQSCQRKNCKNKTYAETGKGVFVEVRSANKGIEEYYGFCSLECVCSFLVDKLTESAS